MTHKYFFERVPQRLIRKLYDDVYKTDFEMFGYKYPKEYIDMDYDDTPSKLSPTE